MEKANKGKHASKAKVSAASAVPESNSLDQQINNLEVALENVVIHNDITTCPDKEGATKTSKPSNTKAEPLQTKDSVTKPSRNRKDKKTSEKKGKKNKGLTFSLTSGIGINMEPKKTPKILQEIFPPKLNVSAQEFVPSTGGPSPQNNEPYLPGFEPYPRYDIAEDISMYPFEREYSPQPEYCYFHTFQSPGRSPPVIPRHNGNYRKYKPRQREMAYTYNRDVGYETVLETEEVSTFSESDHAQFEKAKMDVPATEVNINQSFSMELDHLNQIAMSQCIPPVMNFTGDVLVDHMGLMAVPTCTEMVIDAPLESIEHAPSLEFYPNTEENPMALYDTLDYSSVAYIHEDDVPMSFYDDNGQKTIFFPTDVTDQVKLQDPNYNPRDYIKFGPNVAAGQNVVRQYEEFCMKMAEIEAEKASRAFGSSDSSLSSNYNTLMGFPEDFKPSEPTPRDDPEASSFAEATGTKTMDPSTDLKLSDPTPKDDQGPSTFAEVTRPKTMDPSTDLKLSDPTPREDQGPSTFAEVTRSKTMAPSTDFKLGDPTPRDDQSASTFAEVTRPKTMDPSTGAIKKTVKKTRANKKTSKASPSTVPKPGAESSLPQLPATYSTVTKNQAQTPNLPGPSSDAHKPQVRPPLLPTPSPSMMISNPWFRSPSTTTSPSQSMSGPSGVSKRGAWGRGARSQPPATASYAVDCNDREVMVNVRPSRNQRLGQGARRRRRRYRNTCTKCGCEGHQCPSPRRDEVIHTVPGLTLHISWELHKGRK